MRGLAGVFADGATEEHEPGEPRQIGGRSTRRDWCETKHSKKEDCCRRVASRAGLFPARLGLEDEQQTDVARHEA